MTAKRYRLPEVLGGHEVRIVHRPANPNDLAQVHVRIGDEGFPLHLPMTVLDEVPPPLPPEPEPGAYLIGEGIVRRISESPNDCERWAVLGYADWLDWPAVCHMMLTGRADVEITPLVAAPDVTLPWSLSAEGDRPWSVSVEVAANGFVLVSTTVNHRGAGVTLNPDSTEAMAHALLAAARAVREGSGT